MTREEMLAEIAAANKQGREAVLRGADLRDANLYGTNLSGVDLREANLREADLREAALNGRNLVGADLCEANLREANLYGANLRGANLRGADLRGADLLGANLRGAKINWQSHDLIAELLRQHADDSADKRSLAGLVLISQDWCWDRFLTIEHPQKEWALKTLSGYVQEGDGAPEILLQYKNKEVNQ